MELKINLTMKEEVIDDYALSTMRLLNYCEEWLYRKRQEKFMCKECSRQFVENHKNKIISVSEWKIVDKFLLEKISIAGISRVVNI